MNGPGYSIIQINWDGVSSGFCSAVKAYSATDPNDLTGRLPVAASGIYALSPLDAGFKEIALFERRTTRAVVGAEMLCATGLSGATMDATHADAANRKPDFLLRPRREVRCWQRDARRDRNPGHGSGAASWHRSVKALMAVTIKLSRGAKPAQSEGAQRKVPIMSDHDLPPEFRRRRLPEAMPMELPLQLPFDDEPPPLLNPDSALTDQQRNPAPYLRQS